MALLPKRLAQFVATTSEATYYTVGAGLQALIKQILVANTSGGVVTLGLSIVPSGGTGGNANRILPNISVQPNQIVPFNLTQSMAAGDKISAIASANTAVTVTVSGMEG